MFVVFFVEVNGVEEGGRKILRRSNRRIVTENTGRMAKFLFNIRKRMSEHVCYVD